MARPPAIFMQYKESIASFFNPRSQICNLKQEIIRSSLDCTDNLRRSPLVRSWNIYSWALWWVPLSCRSCHNWQEHIYDPNDPHDTLARSSHHLQPFYSVAFSTLRNTTRISNKKPPLPNWLASIHGESPLSRLNVPPKPCFHGLGYIWWAMKDIEWNKGRRVV